MEQKIVFEIGETDINKARCFKCGRKVEFKPKDNPMEINKTYELVKCTCGNDYR